MKIIFSITTLLVAIQLFGGSKHWSYIKPEKPTPPSVKNQSQVSSPIDAFILEKLELKGWKFSKATDKARLLRRVYLDLIGLPPTLEELDSFLTDDSENAYEKVVDSLLESPRYGEHWARQWLDLARYADSNGFQADQIRESWAYRDWVIDAMNADMPFDQFTIEQIAGDLLPDATLKQKTATGFHRTPTCNVEAGVDPEENRTNQVVDRVNTTGTVWLGTSIECSQCHEHKYDPFSQEEYYQLFSFFNNTPVEVQSGGGVQYNFFGPKMDLPMSPEKQEKRKKLEAKLKIIEKEISDLENALKPEITKAFKRDKLSLSNKSAELPTWKALDPKEWNSSGGEPFELLKDKSLLAGRAPGDTAVYTITTKVSGKKISAIRMDALTHDSLKGKGPGRNKTNNNPNFVLTEFSVKLINKDGIETPLSLTNPVASFSQSNFNPKQLIDGNKSTKNGWAIAPRFGEAHWVKFDLQSSIEPEAESSLVFTLEHLYGGGRNIGRVKLSESERPHNAKGEEKFDKNILAILQKKNPSKKEIKAYADHFLKNHRAHKELSQKKVAAQKDLDAVKPHSTLIMVEMEKPRKTHMHIRGEFLNKGEEQESGTPAALHSWNDAWPKNRLGLANWLTSKENPLVARVTVNRWWAQMMGRGIVSTEEDFGSQGDPPTHPKLLDWLASEFMENNWSMKHIHRIIVMSTTYQQDSRVKPEHLNEDPLNKLYARGPRFRMTAEMIRDNALQVSGLLSSKMHGPTVFPPQPDGLWRQTGRNEPKYTTSQGEDRFRRGIYVIWRRAAPYPSFVNFDGPDRSACHPKRSRTNTPLQALTLLNDEAYVEMALAFADSILSECSANDSVEDKLRHAFRRTLSRAPSNKEIQILTELYQLEKKEIEAAPERSRELLKGITGYKPSPGQDSMELALWFAIANTLLNLDETITKS